MQYCKTFKTKTEISHDLGFGHEFLHTISKAWETKEGTNQLDFVKIKKCIFLQDTVERLKHGKKIFTEYISAKTMFPKYTGNYRILTIWGKKHSIKKWAKTRDFTEADIHMAN